MTLTDIVNLIGENLDTLVIATCTAAGLAAAWYGLREYVYYRAAQRDHNGVDAAFEAIPDTAKTATLDLLERLKHEREDNIATQRINYLLERYGGSRDTRAP